MTQVGERPWPVDAPRRRSTVGRTFPLLALGAALVLWASAFVVIGRVSNVFSPGALALGRLLVASVALGFLCTIRRRTWRRPGRGDLIRIAVIGALWFACYNIALNAGQQRVDVGTAAMLTQVSPLLVAVMATLILGESSSWRTWVGLFVAFAGVSMISLASAGRERDMGGVVLCLLAAAVSAVGLIVHKPLLMNLSGLQIISLACAAGAVACLPYTGALTHDLARATGGEMALVVYLGVFPTAIAFIFYSYALSHMSVSGIAASTFLVPPLTIAMAWFVLGVSPAPVALVGGALCLVGVLFSRRQPTAHTRTPQPAPVSRLTR